MTRHRLIVEMGMGTDLHGADSTKAACRAVEDALRRASLDVLSLPGLVTDGMRIDVTIAVPDPAAVDTDAVAALVPHGPVAVRVVHGGLHLPDGRNAAHTVATAAIEVFLPDQSAAFGPA